MRKDSSLVLHGAQDGRCGSAAARLVSMREMQGFVVVVALDHRSYHHF